MGVFRRSEAKTKKKSKLRGGVSVVKTVVGILFAAIAIGGFVLMYLTDFKRLRADIGHWLVAVDEHQREAHPDS